MENLTGALSRVWHFRHLKPQDLRRIVSAGQVRRFTAGKTIFHEAAPSAGMFVLLKGKVHLCRHSTQGHMQIISTIEPVIMFNELSVIDGLENPFTAVADKDSLTWNIDHDAFHDLLRTYPDPEIGIALLKVLASRSRSLINRCEDLSSRPVHARLAKLLLELSAGGAQPIDRSEYPIKQLAAHIASVPEVVSRSLSMLDDDGCIHCSRQQIVVANAATLAERAQLASTLENEGS